MLPHLLYRSVCDQRRTKHRMATRRREVSSSNSSSITVKNKSRYRHRHRRCRLLQSDWSNINYNVLERVQKKLPFADTLKCRAVCSRWRSVTQKHISSSLNSPPPAQLPPLVLWYEPLRFFDALRPRKQLYHLNDESKRLFGRQPWFYCVGLDHGWFLFLDHKKINTLCMFHPLSAAAVRFPPIVTPEGFETILNGKFDFWDTFKVVLWADPILSNGNYGIAVIHPRYRKLLFAKAGATQFTGLDYPDKYRSKWEDIICFQSCIYGVTLTADGQHHMEAWDCTGPDASPRKILDFQPKFSSGSGPSSLSTLRLVESQGRLLLVSIQRPDRREARQIVENTRFDFRKLFVLARSPDTVRVYKMDFLQRKWVQMDSLGDCVLFFMESQSLSVSTHEFPQYKRNTIYFEHKIEVCCIVKRCVSVFDMEDGSLKEIWPK